jgi:hypothetical protein
MSSTNEDMEIIFIYPYRTLFFEFVYYDVTYLGKRDFNLPNTSDLVHKPPAG